MAKELEKAYQPDKVEGKIYRQWEESGFFNPDKLPAGRYSLSANPFTIIMPPPNANGALHIGHAVFVTLQDIMIRFERMRGRKALWLPGADHAGFETQVVFDKKLEKEGRNRFEIPREKLYREMLEFTLANKKIMEAQLKKLGASCDWSREKFTLDKDIIDTVYATFQKLYDDGLVYRDFRVVNWCVRHQTSLSDLEVKYAEREDPLYYIKYGPLEIATVRPETKFGDTALAVNPKDKRYKKYIGKEITAEGLLGPLRLKVIADDAVDPKFGTGVVKVTPAHDAADFDIWQRHKDEIPGPKIVIDERGRLTADAGRYAGLKAAEARMRVAEDLEKFGLMARIEPNYKHNISACYKCGTTLEPLVKPQWFIRMTEEPRAEKQKAKSKKQNYGRSLRDMAIEAVKKGEIKFVPKRMEKIFMHWMKNLRDWNISRQIVWGIRIPAWYRGEEIYVGVDKPSGGGWVQDPDVFDTWFSSGQWPFAALLASRGGKEKKEKRNEKLPWTTKDYETFYPTDVMETGWDILFFWVARMIMLGLYRTGKIPFKTVYLHGLVRDKDRQKMSKSKGNVIDPLGVAEQYGTDAVRMALTIGNLPGNDIVISEEKIRGYRNFANKLWNIHRFIRIRFDAELTGVKSSWQSQGHGDRKYLEELERLVEKTTKDIENFRFHHAAERLYHYTWHTFADKIMESVKPRLESKDKEERVAALVLLVRIHQTLLKLLHPFMPFITEALWSDIPVVPGRKRQQPLAADEGLLMVQSWPSVSSF